VTRDPAADVRREFAVLIPLFVWTAAWVASLAAAKFLPDLVDSGARPVVAWIAVGVTIAVGIGWIVAQARYLRAIDELQRKIQLDALAVALGVAVVGGFAASLAGDRGLLPELDIAFAGVAAAVAYVAAVLVGNLRYR
jgi:hypothetical protein